MWKSDDISQQTRRPVTNYRTYYRLPGYLYNKFIYFFLIEQSTIFCTYYGRQCVGKFCSIILTKWCEMLVKGDIKNSFAYLNVGNFSANRRGKKWREKKKLIGDE